MSIVTEIAGFFPNPGNSSPNVLVTYDAFHRARQNLELDRRANAQPGGNHYEQPRQTRQAVPGRQSLR